MSLQVWLPLNGDINNQGICNSLEVSAGTPQYIDGKMGQGIDISHRVIFSGLPRLDNFSIFFWLKVDSCTVSWADSLGFDCKQADGTNAASFRFEATTETRACSWHNNSPYGISSGSQILIQNYEEWHHVGLTYDGDNVYSYIDGKLKYTNSGLGGYLIDRFWIGETGNIVGAMNDLRIYDNVLSKSEIKEISKGLVLHYNFEDPYCEPTENLRETIYISDTTSTDYQKLISGNDNIGNYYIKPYGAISWSGLGLPSTSVEAGKIYTWSFDIMPNKQSSVSFDGNVSASNYSGNDAAYSNYGYHSGIVGKTGSILPANKWSRVYVTCAANADAVDAKMFHTFNTSTKETDKEIKYYYRNVLFEKKPFPTPYTPSKREDSIVGGGSFTTVVALVMMES